MGTQLEGLVGNRLDPITQKLQETIELQLRQLDKSSLLFDDLLLDDEQPEFDTNQPITVIRGIGPKTAAKLDKLGISSIQEIARP